MDVHPPQNGNTNRPKKLSQTFSYEFYLIPITHPKIPVKISKIAKHVLIFHPSVGPIGLNPSQQPQHQQHRRTIASVAAPASRASCSASTASCAESTAPKSRYWFLLVMCMLHLPYIICIYIHIIYIYTIIHIYIYMYIYIEGGS